ncbi:AAA family ATPase [Methanoplanus sp. FWC-SCC4]|uniref:AAA family ATPase n=1 Tax=Methanochimaera problematica TaxID=2609417 RepID=A0AA97I245_9EURY|nr:AAA family ATPase [Methanoplanus sp. FWC-SCC4]
MTVITFAHHKGGTGKTTSCLSIAGFLQKSGEKVLVVDCDPQANATSGLGVEPDGENLNMYDVFMNVFEGFPDVSIKEIIKETSSGIFLAPSSLDLVGVEPYLYNIDDRLMVLKDALKPVLKDYKWILIDTPPSMGQFVLNGILAADRIILTLDTSIFAKNGIGSITSIFEDINENTGRKRSADMAILTRAGVLRERKSTTEELSGLIKNIFSKDNSESREQIRQDELEADIKGIVKEVHIIPYDAGISESHIKGLPISHISPETPAGMAYKKISEIVSKW